MWKRQHNHLYPTGLLGIHLVTQHTRTYTKWWCPVHPCVAYTQYIAMLLPFFPLFVAYMQCVSVHAALMVLTIVRKLNMNTSIEWCNRACDYMIVLYLVRLTRVKCRSPLLYQPRRNASQNACDFVMEIGHQCAIQGVQKLMLWQSIHEWIFQYSTHANWKHNWLNKIDFEYSSVSNVSDALSNRKRIWWLWHLRWWFSCATFATSAEWLYSFKMCDRIRKLELLSKS